MLLAFWPAFINRQTSASVMNEAVEIQPMLVPIRKPFNSREVIPRRLPAQDDALRDDDAIFIALLM